MPPHVPSAFAAPALTTSFLSSTKAVSIDDALAYQFSPDEQAIADEFMLGAVIGGPAHVAERLRATARDAGAQELMLSTLVPDLAARQASLERIARES